MCAAMLDVTKAWEQQTLEHDRIVICCACSPCGKYVVAGAQDENLLRWNLETGEKTVVPGHESWVQAVAFHSDQKQLLSGDMNGVLKAWDYTAETPKLLWSVPDAHQPWALAALASPDGKQWITSGTEGRVRRWNVADGSSAGEFKGHETEVYSLALHPHGKELASGDLFGNICIWNLASGQLVRKLDAKPLHTREEDFLADVGGVRSLAFNSDGSLLAAGGMTDAKSNTFCPGSPAVLVFDYASGKLKQTLRPKAKSDGPIKGLCFLSDGTIAGHGEMINAKASMEFWNPDNPAPLHSMVRESAYAISPHPDGIRLALANFITAGKGGNGRNGKPEEYRPHAGAVTIINLQEKPAAEKKA
jgi:WD40 repeat protein